MHIDSVCGAIVIVWLGRTVDSALILKSQYFDTSLKSSYQTYAIRKFITSFIVNIGQSPKIHLHCTFNIEF